MIKIYVYMYHSCPQWVFDNFSPYLDLSCIPGSFQLVGTALSLFVLKSVLLISSTEKNSIVSSKMTVEE